MFLNLFKRQTRSPFSRSFGYTLAILLGIAALQTGVARAQLAGTGAISGTVQDATGAVVAGAKVTATDTDTNVGTERTTTKAGDFNITPLIPGNYTLTVSAPGFEGYKQENITVNALETVGLNISLTIGQTSETVTVTSAPPLLETTDATLGATMDNTMYSNLPLQMSSGGNADQRRATDFATLMPGVSNVFTGSNNATDATTGVNGSGPAGGVQEIYVDGVSLPEADGVGDPRFTWTAIGVDSIDQFQVQTAGISAQYAGQGVQNYAIKSGGNTIHGSLYEYNRNTLFDAWNFTAKVPTLNGQGVLVPGGIKPREIQNEFGIVLSGPIIKNKLFLFGNYGQYREQKGATFASYTIPTAAMLGINSTGGQLGYADFTGYALANGGSKCTSTAAEGVAANGCYDIYDPSTEAVGCLGTAASPCNRTPFQGMKNGVPTYDVISGSRLSAASLYIDKYWAPYEALANQSLYTNNLNYGTPTGLANWYSTGRIDYNQSSRNQISAIIAFGRQASTGPNSTSGLGPPFNTSQAYHPVTTVDILKDTFTFTPHVVNQFALGYGRYVSVSVTPDDAPQYNAASLGLLGTPAGQASNGFPEIQWSGGANTALLATQAGYSWNSKANNTYTVTDNVQWNLGRHNFTFGGQYSMLLFGYYKSLGPTGPMDYSFSAAPTQAFNSITSSSPGIGTATLAASGSPVATYMLGAATGESVLNPFVPGLRTVWRDPSFWGQDDFKVNERLTVNMGLRWDIYPSIQEAHNIFSFFNPNGQNSITGNLGTIEFAGSGNSALYCNCSSPSPIYWKNVAPRLGFAFSANSKTVFRGSYSVNYARGNWTSGSQSGSPSTVGYTPSGATPTQATPAFPLIYWDNTACAQGTNSGVNCGFNGSINPPTPPTGGTSLAEYGTGNNSTTSSSGSGISYFDPYRGSRTPEFENWTFGIQRQITRDMSITVSYVGSEGHFISGGLDPWQRKNSLPSSYAQLAAYQPSGTSTIPCTGLTCLTPLLGTKYTATNLALFEGLGFTPPNPYTGGVTYSTSLSTSGYFTYFPQYGVSDTTNFTGNTNYHALQLTLRQRAAHGLDFMFNYTFSKSIDDVGTFRTTDNARLDRSLSVTDQPENITATVVYQSPFGKNGLAAKSFLVRSLAKDWNLSGIYTYHSGSPIVATGTGCPGTPLGTCMPSVVPFVQPRTLSYNKPAGGLTANSSASNYYAKIQHLNPAAFTVLDATNSTPTNSQQIAAGLGLAAYQVGTAARVGADNIWSQGWYNVDLGLKRSFPIYERLSLQFEADCLNATNHVTWGGPGGGVGGSSYGLITGESSAYIPRDFQLSGRLNW